MVRRVLVLATLGWLAAAGWLVSAPDARADGVLTDREAMYVRVNGPIVCAVIGEHPTESGVYGVTLGVMEDGLFTADNAVDVVNEAVLAYCPEWWSLLVRIGAEARGEIAKQVIA